MTCCCYREDPDIVTVLIEESFVTEKVIFKGQKSSVDNQKLIENIVAAMDSRFPSSEIVDSTSISSVKNWQNTAGYISSVHC